MTESRTTVAAVERNGAARKPRAARRPRAAAGAVTWQVPMALAPVEGRGGRMRTAITLGMGCGIPCLSLALSSIGGRLCVAGHLGLGTAALLLCCSVLAVSLSHLAWAIGDITRSARWQAWCLAGAIDLCLVLGELAGVAGFELWTVTAVMAAVTVTSAVLNTWAFLREGR
jgi:hypothetical protein